MQIKNSRKVIIVGLMTCFFLTGVWAQKRTPTKVIYFMAGPKDHAGLPGTKRRKIFLFCNIAWIALAILQV